MRIRFNEDDVDAQFGHYIKVEDGKIKKCMLLIICKKWHTRLRQWPDSKIPLKLKIKPKESIEISLF